MNAQHSKFPLGRGVGATLFRLAGTALFVTLLVAPAAPAATLFGAASGEPEVLYQLDTVAQTATPVCTIAPGLAPANPSSPNGLGYDAANDRLYFSINTDTGDGSPSGLYFCDLNTGAVTPAGTLVGQAAGATFDQSTGQYLYIRNRTDDLVAVSLDGSGIKVSETVIAPSFSAGVVLFRGGDLAVDCNGLVYGSSLGTGGGTKAFFSVDLANGNAFSMVHLDPAGDNGDTGFATAKQISFGQDGSLISQTGGTYWLVDASNGSQTAIGAIPNGSPLAMTDLASGLDCQGAGSGCETDLIAGGGSEEGALDVGDVTVAPNNDGTWNVTYATTGSWQITEVHLEAACDLADIPQNKSGNPTIGQFCFQDTPPAGTQSYTVSSFGTAECHDASCDCTVFAAHAVVTDVDSCLDAPLEEECVLRTETAWGEGRSFPGKSWAMYFECGDCE